MIQTGDPQFVRYQDQSNASFLSFGGGPRRGNAYLLEGVSITDFLNRAAWVPSTEAIEDMRVQVKTYDADMGRAAGGVFNVTARSGSNQLSRQRALREQARLGHADSSSSPSAPGAPKPPQYYYGLGGLDRRPDRPRTRPSSGSARTTTCRRARATTCLTVPTALERTGDFSQSRNAAGQLIVIYDPLTTRSNRDRPASSAIRSPATSFPANRINPIAVAMLANMPLPTTGRSFNGQATLDDGPQNQETVKLDQRWSDRWTTTGMYGHQHTQEPGSAFWGAHGTVAGDPGGGMLYRDGQLLRGEQHLHPGQHHDRGRALRLQPLQRRRQLLPARSTPARSASPS